MLKGDVLLLNQSFEVLRVVPVRRAICMMLRFDNPAVMVESTGNTFRSASGEQFEIPSVVRLSEYKDIRNKIRKANIKRLKVIIRDNFRCAYCGIKPGTGKLTLDHVLPKSKGGKDVPENLVASCFSCNNKKGDRTPEQAKMPLLKKPKPMNSGVDRMLFRYYLERHPEWADYLFDSNTGDGRFQYTGD